MSNLIKSRWIVLNQEESRLIDSNARMEKKMQEQSQLLSESVESIPEPDDDGFTQGFEADQIDALLSDDASVIKAEPEEEIQEGPTPEELLQEAKGQADIILKEAREQAEAIKSQAQAEGYQDGIRAGTEEMNQKKEEQEQMLLEREASLLKAYTDKMEELEPMFVNLITDIYENIFHIQLADFKEIVLYSIHHVIGDADGKRDFIIRVSSDDYEFISSKREEILELAPANATVEIMRDATMTVGECVIESDGGIFDCGIDTQLQSLTKEIRLLSYQKK